jgi:DNA repair photolyase
MQYERYEAKSMINKLRHVDDWFWVSYTVNPYRGCSHGCIYCDARANQYGLSEAFDEKIWIKDNAVSVLKQQLPRVKPDVVGMGGVCDSYQAIEKERGLTREIVETLYGHRFPVEVLTKSDLVLRDLDLYQEVDRGAWACVFFTITSFDPHVAGRFEPAASTPEERIAAMAEVAGAGLTTGVAMMPLLPGISDDDHNIDDVVRRVKDAGAQFVLGGGLTLKEGAQRDRYMAFLDLYCPQVVPLYRRLYGEGLEPRGSYGPQLLRRVRDICAQHGIQDRMSRPILAGEALGANKRVAEKLLTRAYELTLEEAEAFRVWAYRKAGWAIDEMEANVESIYLQEGREGLKRIKGVGESLAREIEGWLRSSIISPRKGKGHENRHS